MLDDDKMAWIDAQAAIKLQRWIASDHDVGADNWPVPTPLPDALPSVDSFDAELLPVALRP